MSMDFYHHTYPKARKEHKCEYCGQKIEIAQKYSYETGKYDGDMFSRKLCLTCENILEEYCKSAGYEEFDWWDVSDWLSDFYCYDCKHGTRENDDCQYNTQNCPLIRMNFEQKGE